MQAFIAITIMSEVILVDAYHMSRLPELVRDVRWFAMLLSWLIMLYAMPKANKQFADQRKAALEEFMSHLDLSKHQFALGDPSCLNSAKSPILRCAVNPSGPCAGCPDRKEIPNASDS
jgi:hypothetical protein